MDISQVITFDGSPDQLVWKSPVEDFNTSSILVVPETHVALLVVNGNACDLFPAGRHTLETPNIPLVKKIINIPTNGKTSFPCKVFFINKVHQMDITWGIPGEITLNDPKYDIFLHIGMCGNMNFRINDDGARQFMLKLVGFRNDFDAEELVSRFRGIIKQYVKSAISKIMNVGGVSYFDMNENLFEISNVVKEQLIPIFLDYGIDVLQFNIESITVPDEDFEAVKRAKERATSRRIEGISIHEENKYDILKTAAGNTGAMGSMSGAVGGFMMGGAFGGSIADMARSAFNNGGGESTENQTQPAKIGSGSASPFDVAGFMSKYTGNTPTQETSAPAPEAAPAPSAFTAPAPEAAPAPKISAGGKFCPECGHQLAPGAKFCDECGTKVQAGNVCGNCGYVFTTEMKFCPECGTKRV